MCPTLMYWSTLIIFLNDSTERANVIVAAVTRKQLSRLAAETFIPAFSKIEVCCAALCGSLFQLGDVCAVVRLG